jgi:hypothetical protein
LKWSESNFIQKMQYKNYYKAIRIVLVMKDLNSMYEILDSILVDNICKQK